MAYRDVVLADNPLDFYEFETSAGTDSGSGGRTLTLNGGITTGVAGRNGNAWSFDGVNDNAEMTTFPSLTNAFTFEAVVKPADISANNSTPTIIRKDGTDIVLVRIRGGANTNPGQAEVYIDGTTLLSGTAARVDDGKWHTIHYTQSGNTARLYVDGVLCASATTTQNTFNFGTGAGAHIGSDNNGTGEFWVGLIDSVAIYNTALSATKIAARATSYHEAVAADAPKFWATYNGSYNDSGSNGSGATGQAGVSIASDAIGGTGRGLALVRSTTSYIDYASLPANTTNSGTFTMETWIKTTDTGSGIFMGSLSTPYYYGGLNTGGTPYFIANAATLTGPNPVNDGRWHHLVAVFTSGGTHRLYVDGVQVATTTGTSTGPAGAHSFRIGNNASAYGLNATLDEPAIYASALSSTRVGAHYTAGAPDAIIDVPTVTMALQGVEPAFYGDPNSKVDVTTPTISVAGVDFASIVEGLGTRVDVATPTMSAVANEVTYEERRHPVFGAALETYANGGVVNDTPSNISGYSGGNYTHALDFNLPSEFLTQGLISATFNFNVSVTGATGETYKVRRITAPWTNTSKSFSTSTEYVSFVSNTGAKSLDVSSLMTQPGDFYGLAITYDGANTNSYIVVPDGGSLNLYYKVLPPLASVDVTVDTPTISLTTIEPDSDIVMDVASATIELGAQDVTVSGGAGVDNLTPTVSVSANDVTVDSTELPDVIIDLDNITPILATAHEATFVYSEVVDVDSASVSLQAQDTTVETVASVSIEVDAPRMRLVAPVPTDVNGEPILPTEAEDPYFESTWNTFGGVTFGLTGNTAQAVPPETALWYRFNEYAGDKAYDRAWVYRNAAGEIVPTPGIESGRPVPLNLNGVVIGQHEGPDGRHNFAFTGYSHIEGIGQGSIGGLNNNLEFTFRTTRSTQFIMGGAGLSQGVTNNSVMQPWELWMVDGVLEVRQFKNYSQNGLPVNRVVEVTKMRTRLDDGKWHHVVIQRAAGSVDERSAGAERYFMFESYVDGRLETRKRVGNIAFNFPQYIGGRPNNYYRAGDTYVMGDNLSADQWFKGEMTELVYRYNDNLTENEVTLQRDNVMNIDVYRAETARVTFKNTDVEVRGNKPRILILDFGGYQPRTINGPGTAPESRIVNFPISQAGKNMADQMEFYTLPADYVPADFPGYGEVHTPWYSSNQTGMTQWFRFDVRQKMDANGNTTNETYRDEVTDNYRLIDLEKDLNMDDYDMISIIGFPQNSNMWSRFEDMDFKNLAPFVPARKQVENLMDQVKDQVINHRKSLYITDPFSAIELGIIDKAEGVPWYKEHFTVDTRIGANSGGIDWHSFITDPFGTAVANGNVIPRPLWGFDPRDPRRYTTNRRLAGTYEDTHINVRQRVRNIVQGLTTNYGWIKTDDIVWWNINPMANPPFHRSIRYEDKRGPGLSIGDLFYMSGDHIYDSGFMGAGVLERKAGFVAAPMSAIKVGKAVTTFGATISATGNHMEVDLEPEELLDGTVFDMEIGNVYGDHAISIVVEPGDVWDGQFVFGKVYVNFTEFNVWNPEFLDGANILMFATRHPELLPAQVISLGETIKTGYDREFVVTTEMLRYQWSTHFGSYQGSQIPLPEGGKTSDWGWSSGGVRESGGFSSYGAGEAMRWGWTPATKLEPISTPTMYQKGFRWLLDDLDVGGVVNASVEVAKMTAKANDVTVDTVQNAVVDVPTTRISLESYSDADTISPNVTVQVGTPEINVKVIGLTEYIDVETPTIILDVPILGAGEATADWNEALIFTLPRQYITLTMEEG